MKSKIAVIGLKGLPAFGGAATVGENTLIRLVDKYDFTVYSVESHVKDSNYNIINQVVFKNFPIKKLNIFLYYLKSCFHVLLFKKYDLIHLHHIDAAFIMFFLRLKYKIISTNHGMPYLHGKWPKYLIPYFYMNEKIHLNLSNRVIVVSKSLQRHFSNNKLSKKIEFIPNGVNINSNPKKNSEKLFHLSFVAGRIIRIKGLHLLLEAIIKNNSDYNLLAIGNLNHEKNYKKKFIDPLTPNIKIEFKDVIFDKNLLFEEIRSSRYFIFPSLVEAMSTMLLEVASIGVPIICSDIIQNRDIFSEDEVLFFKSNDSTDLSEKIKYASQNPSRMKEMATMAKEKVEKQYNWDSISKKYGETYDALLHTQ